MAYNGELKRKSTAHAFERPQEESTEAKAGGNGWGGYFDAERGQKQKPTSLLSRRSDLRGDSALGDVPTPPIDVPVAKSEAYDTIMAAVDGPLGGRFDGSLDGYMQHRRPSISFHSEVTLENGGTLSLEQPIPKLQIKTRPRGKSLLEEMRSKATVTPMSDEAAQVPVEGMPVPMAKETAFLRQQPRSSLLQSPVDMSPGTSTPSDLVQSLSLTSETSVSPVQEEPNTPPDDDAPPTFLSPRSPLFPWRQPNSLSESSAWPRSDQPSLSSRAKSYTLDRSSSLRSLRRQQLNRRSTSSSMSPASAFLSKWVRDESSHAPEPDGEGQEVGDFVLGKQIGSGGFSIVREAYSLAPATPSAPMPSKRMVHAVKIVRRQVPGAGEHDNDALQGDFDHEVALWRCLQHPHILQLVAVNFTPFATFAFSTLTTGGTLFDMVRQHRRGLGAALARRYAAHLARALRYLHEDVRIVHRDVKLENCLIDVADPASARLGGTLLLCDFGLAAEMRHERNVGDEEDEGGDDDDDADGITVRNTNHNAAHSSAPVHATALPNAPPIATEARRTAIGPSATSTSIAGSLPYAAPEVVRGPRPSLRPGVDVWALGCVVYACVVGDLPFQHALPGRVRELILTASWDTATLRSRVRGWQALEAQRRSMAGRSEARPLDAAASPQPTHRIEDEVEAVAQLVGGCFEVDIATRWSIGMCLRAEWLAGLGGSGGDDDDDDVPDVVASEPWSAGPRP